MTNNLNLIKPLTVQEVIETWRGVEENLEHWQSFWKAKNHSSWEDWRRTTHKAVLDKPLNWSLYKVSDPITTVSEWRGGMFNSWNKWFYVNFDEKPPRFKDLLAHPGVHNHWYVREISKNFETPTTVTAIRLPNGDISVVEGMHRCCALALLAHNKESLDIDLNVILADWPDPELPKLGHWPENK